jgi:hypothetical protein
MKSNIFVPEKINVGFQNRTDTYTKKLAYVIYFDQKGVLRKEKSWNSWRDDKIESIVHENVPTSGFVLNKKVGDYVSDWNHRQAYVRVYDPRDFEFEITIENLLYILENASSIKGKGLEGDFIYGWDGKELVLIPTDSPDYVEISQFNEIIHSNSCIKAKDLIIGATYKTKTNEEWIYMGRFDYWKSESERVEAQSNRNSYYGRQYSYIYKDVNKGKYHYFVRDYKYDWESKPTLKTLQLKSIGDKFISVVSSDCIENYADFFDRLECTIDYSPLDKNKDEYIKYSYEEFSEKFVDNRYSINCFNVEKREFEVGKVYNTVSQYYYRDRNNYGIDKKDGTIEEVFNQLQPMYKNQYLQNGKLYREGK